MLVPLEEARRAVDAAPIRSPRVVSTSVTGALGKLAAATVTAREPLPRERRSAMDGYAVRLVPGRPVAVFVLRAGLLRSTGPANIALAEGEASPIATGLPLPKGANAVVRAEAALVQGNALRLRHPARPGQDVLEPGEVMERGERILQRGEPVRAAHVGALLAQRIRSIPTYRIRIAIAPIGDEVLRPGSRSPDGVPDFLSPIIANLLGFAEVRVLPPTADDRSRVGRVLEAASRRSDLLFTIGGSSVGPKDVTKAAIVDVGRLLFEGVSANVLKRGAVGFVRRTPVVVLPGQVVSAVAAFHEHGLHVLARMVGRETRRYEEVTLAREVLADHRMDSVYLFRVSGGVATPLPWGVARMMGLLQANAFGLLAHGRRYPSGEPIRVQRLWSSGGSGPEAPVRAPG